LEIWELKTPSDYCIQKTDYASQKLKNCCCSQGIVVLIFEEDSFEDLGN